MARATAIRDGDTLRIQGELDFDSVAVLWESAESLFLGEPLRWIDLGAVSRSNSGGVALLVEWLGQARRRQWEPVFINVPTQMRAIIEVADLETILPVI